jgi:hypothetical protein
MKNTITDNIKNLKKIYMSDASLGILMDFERVLDSMDLYVFPNWQLGELVEGPEVNKYWVRCKFMWPYNLMPDPSGAKRLIPYGAKITYQKDTVMMPVKIKSPDDYRDGSKKGKLIEMPVWYVDILLPKYLLSEIKQGSVEIAGEDIDLSELQTAYEKDFDQKALTVAGGAQAQTDMSAAPGEGGAPAGMPAAGAPNVSPA